MVITERRRPAPKPNKNLNTKAIVMKSEALWLYVESQKAKLDKIMKR